MGSVARLAVKAGLVRGKTSLDPELLLPNSTVAVGFPEALLAKWGALAPIFNDSSRTVIILGDLGM
jgi:hypothetical protein